ncbi:MAG: cytochrome c maturation protein CcmE [Chloroflexi bacterium]|nr:cytochrome c maturation protein CcmE [Chloroflexota bacterium]
MSKKQITIVAVTLIALVGIVVGFKLLTSPGGPGGVPNHITIAQAKADKSGQPLKVGGDVVPGSITWDNASQSMRFTLADEGDRMQVVYQGVAPNDFKPGSPLVVEGTYSPSGVFRAASLTTRTSPLCKTCHPGG